MKEYRLTDKQIASLKMLHRTLHDKRQADRVKTVVLLGTGWMPGQVAEVLFLDDKTVRSYFLKFVQGGEDELLAMHFEGRSCWLTEEQQAELAAHLDENTCLSSGDVARHILNTYGIHYSPTGVKELLHRLGFVYKKPKHVPGKLDPEAQAAFLDEYEKLKKIKGENDPIYFADAVHPQFNSIPAWGWIRRGKDKELKSNSGRKRVNINGALNLETLETTTDFAKTINGESSFRLFKKIEAKHPEAKAVHVILDNASYYISGWLKDKLKDSKIVLHFLPGYSPNLNLIERLWKFFKKKILYNKYYEKFEDFVSACKSFFRCRKKYQAELRTLLVDNFHQYKNF